MTIDEKLFRKNIVVIGGHFGTKITEPILRIYYQHLNQYLDQDEFLRAVELAVIKIPCKSGLPSPEKLVELIQEEEEEEEEVKAIIEWNTILNISARWKPENLAYLSQRGRIALDAIGGLEIVAFYEGSLDKFEEQFIHIYCQVLPRMLKL